MNRSGLRLATAVGLALLVWAAAGTAAPPEPAGYRMDDYRAPTPDTLRGATVLTTDGARALWERQAAVFIDVLPRVPRPAGLPAGTLWRPKPRLDLPGSIWLPDTGYGALAPVMQDYFARGLSRATGGDQARMIVFYCLANCWMSWNAARRAIDAGYRNVAWYPEGTDGWAAEGMPLESRDPEPRPSATE